MMVPALRLEAQVSVQGWFNKRHLFVIDDKIYMEIYRTACGDCPTCYRRTETVLGRLVDSGIEHKWTLKNLNAGTYLVVKPSSMPTDVCAFLSELLKMKIR